METRVIDFKQPLEMNLGKINNMQEAKTKDFNDTLNSVNKKIESKHENSNKLDKKEVKSSKDGSEEKVEEPVEELEKEDKVLYEGMVNLLNIKVEVEQEPEINLEEIPLEAIEIEPITITIDENLNLSDEIILDEEMVNLINLHEDEKDLEKLPTEGSKELRAENPMNVDKEEVKSDLTTQNITKKEINLDVEVDELETDLAINEENNVVNLEQVISEETSSEFDGKNQNSEAKSDSKYELIRSSNNEETLEVSNEAFGPFVKDGIEFATDKPMEVEVPVVVEPKEVIKQIVDQVKFDLSEDNSQMKLTLKPEMLGEMTMNVEVAKEGIIAKIMVDNYRTKEIIEGNMIQLKEGIKDTGMEIKTFEVFVGNGSDFDRHDSNQSNEFNLKQNSKKLRIKTESNKGIKDYEDGAVNNTNEPLNYNKEGGLNLLA